MTSNTHLLSKPTKAREQFQTCVSTARDQHSLFQQSRCDSENKCLHKLVAFTSGFTEVQVQPGKRHATRNAFPEGPLLNSKKACNKPLGAY
jgi:hypothetical protein